MSDWWASAFENLANNARLVGAAAADYVFADGDSAPRTAAEVERQNAEREGREVDPARIERSARGGRRQIEQAARQTSRAVGAKVGDVVDVLGSPWFWGALVLGVVAFVGAPYLTALRKAAPAPAGGAS